MTFKKVMSRKKHGHIDEKIYSDSHYKEIEVRYRTLKKY